MVRRSRRAAAARERLERRRQRVEQRLAVVRGSLRRELGTLAPRRAAWAIPLVAFACGVFLALALRRKKKRANEQS